MRWLDYLKLQIRSRTGFSQGVVVWAVIALVCAIVTFAFLLVAAYVWLAGLFGALFGALIVAGFFLLVALISLAASLGAQRRTTQSESDDRANKRDYRPYDHALTKAGP